MLYERGKVVLEVKKLAMLVVAAMVVAVALDRAITKAWASPVEGEEGGKGEEAKGAKSIKDKVRGFLMA